MAYSYTNPQIGGGDIPMPTTYDEPTGVYGAGTEMLDGSIHYDIIDNQRRVFTLAYRNISSADKLTVDAALTLALSETTFRTPEGNLYTVQLDNRATQIRWRGVGGPSGMRWTATFTLREVA